MTQGNIKINEINGDPLLVYIEDLTKAMRKICQKNKPLNLKVEQSNVGHVLKNHLGILRVSQSNPFQALAFMIPTLMP